MRPLTLAMVLLVASLTMSALFSTTLAAPSYCNIMGYTTNDQWAFSCGGQCQPPEVPCVMKITPLSPPKVGQKYYCFCDGIGLPPVGTCSGWWEHEANQTPVLHCDSTQCQVPCIWEVEFVEPVGWVVYCECP